MVHVFMCNNHNAKVFVQLVLCVCVCYYVCYAPLRFKKPLESGTWPKSFDKTCLKWDSPERNAVTASLILLKGVTATLAPML
mmetsp:Transcript_6647/g.21832  ORF Transcript_6647/g.21832 Transcript_6647/m.21832 type:complete len:82 (-) Transcript_6647:2316-2561(-)